MIKIENTVRETSNSGVVIINKYNSVTIATSTKRVMFDATLETSETLEVNKMDIIQIFSDNDITITLNSVIIGEGKVFTFSKLPLDIIISNVGTATCKVNIFGVNNE